MDLRHLEYVIELARTRSLTKTALNLHVAQPAISQAITGLERQYGVTLFDRSSRPVRPTPAGIVFIEQAARVLDELRALREVADAHASLLRGRVTIGSTFRVGETVLPPILVDFHKMYPGITFVLRRDSFERLVEAVRGGQIDVAFVDMPQTAQPSDLDCFPVHPDEIVVCVPVTHPLANRASIELRELGNEPFIGYEPESNMYAPFTRACRDAGFVPNVIVSAQGQSIARSLVSLGMGISVGSKTYFEGPGVPITTISLSPRMTKDTMLILKSAGESNNVTRPFADYVRQRLSLVGELRYTAALTNGA